MELFGFPFSNSSYMIRFLHSSKLIWIPISVFLFSLSFPILFLSRGNSSCKTAYSGLDQSGDSYLITKQSAKGCFIKGVDSDYRFRLGKLSEGKNTVTVSVNGKKIQSHVMEKQIVHLSIPSEDSISEIDFTFLNPIQKGEVFLFQKKTFEYEAYHGTILALGFLSVAVFVLLYRSGSLSSYKRFFLLWLIAYSLDFSFLKNWPVPYIGDEPHYLLMGESLLEDRDMALENQYSFRKPSLFFRKFDHHTIFIQGVEKPVHYPLLSLYLLPSFLNQNFGIQADPGLAAKILVVLLHSLGTAILLFSFRGRMKKGLEILLLLPIIFGLPWIAYSNQIFPEIPVGILLFICFHSLESENRFGRSFWYPITLIAFPFFHIKFALVSFLLYLYWAYLHRKEFAGLLIGTISYAIGALLFLFYNYLIYKGISPYGSKDLVLQEIPKRYSAYLFDADRGLFALNPILLLFVSFLPILLRKRFVAGIFLIAIVIVGHLPNVFHSNLWLGTCPAGRYWIAVYPLIAYYSAEALAILWDSSKALTGTRRFFLGLVGIAWVLSILQILAFWQNPENYYTQFRKTLVAGNFVSQYIPFPSEKIYYSYFLPDTYWNLIYWCILALLFLGIGIFFSIRTESHEKN